MSGSRQSSTNFGMRSVLSLTVFKTGPDLTAIDSGLRTSRLMWAKRELITSAVLREYLLIDEYLNNESKAHDALNCSV